MKTKFIEIRDEGTLIPALAIEISRADSRLAWRAGYGPEPSIILISLTTGESRGDPWHWPSVAGRTMRVAHEYLRDHWEQFGNNSVCDVRVYLGESQFPVRSDICEPPAKTA